MKKELESSDNSDDYNESRMSGTRDERTNCKI